MIKIHHESGKKRVLFLVASLIRAGAETQVINLANSLDNNKFEKFLFTYHKRIDQYQRIDHENIRFYNRPRRRKLDFSLVRSIAGIIDNEKIDVFHCTGFFSILIGWLSVKLSKSSPHLIAAIHTTSYSSIKAEFIEKAIYQWVLRGCDGVIFVCKKQAEYWKAKYHFLTKKSTVIYNGVDIYDFEPNDFQNQGKDLKRRLSIPDSAHVICCIARFHREKGHVDLIEAFTRLKNNEDNVYLLLAGSGGKKQHIKLLVKKRGLEDSVIFLGDVPDVRLVLAASDISVLASTSETFSIAMLESMSMGVPVVATDIGGLSEAINPGETGELVPPRNPAKLARALLKIINDKAGHSIMKLKCRELVTQRFTTERMVSATERVLSSINVEK